MIWRDPDFEYRRRGQGTNSIAVPNLVLTRWVVYYEVGSGKSDNLQQERAMAKDYAVTITASEVAVEPQVLARRLAELLNRPAHEMEEACRGETIILQKELSYGEAIEIQRELSRRKIPAQVSAHRELSGEEIMMSQSGPAQEAEVNGWAELFPDLVEEEPQGAEEMGWADEESASPAAPPAVEQAWEEIDDEGWPEQDEPLAQSDEPGDEERQSRQFDAEKIHNAFSGGAQKRPPFKPKGFDRRTPHLPLLAALLSLLAPGAGQVYNGQPDKSQWYGTTFFLLYPWFDSVRQAWRRAEKVRTYYAPRPEEGVARRVSSYVVKWWVAVAAVAALSGWTYSMVQDYLDGQEAHRKSIVVQDLVFASAETVEIAVERANRAAEAVEIEEEEIEPERRGKYTMDTEERARRLFIMGYHYCAASEYSMCEQAMRRVSVLAPENRDARRLQAWASLQERGGVDEEMPEVGGEVPTIEEFEVELATQGVDLDELDDQIDQWWDAEGDRQ